MTGLPFVVKGLYWRFDYCSSGAIKIPVLVCHVNQEVHCQLHLYNASANKDALLCAVDLRDSLVIKSGNKPGPLVKYIGRGKTNPEKMDSLQLHQLQRTSVLDHEGKAVPGFPSVLLQIPWNMCTHSKTAVGLENYQHWTPPDEAYVCDKYTDVFWENTQELYVDEIYEISSTARKQKLLAIKEVILLPCLNYMHTLDQQ